MTISAMDILYGSDAVRVPSSGWRPDALHLPIYLDPVALDASSRFEFILDDISWAGSGNLWIAGSAEGSPRLLEEWSHLDLDVPEVRTANSLSAQDYLEHVKELEKSEGETAYEMSRPVSIEHTPDAPEATMTVSSSIEGSEKHRLSAQRWSAVEHVAGSGGEWRYLSFYVPDAQAESKQMGYQQLVYFHEQELRGSVTLDW